MTNEEIAAIVNASLEAYDKRNAARRITPEDISASVVKALPSLWATDAEKAQAIEAGEKTARGEG